MAHPSRLLTLLSVGLFGASLTLNCYCTDPTSGLGSGDPCATPGLNLLALGWLGVFAGQFAWLANPLLFLVWGLTWWRPRAAGLGLAAASGALLLAGSFLLTRQILMDEGGHYAALVAYRAGYWLWLGSTASQVVAGVVSWLRPAAPAAA